MKATGVRGRLELIIGCMFSNKTMTLLTRVERHHIARRRCVIIKHSIDTRYDHLAQHGGLVCNNGIEFSTISVISAAELTPINVAGYDVIGVTESQFFPDLPIVDAWADAGKTVICDGLDADSNRQPFGLIHKLLNRCERVDKLTAICVNCGEEASFTKRVDQAPGAPQIAIGGADKYKPVCRQCYLHETITQ